MNKKPFVLLPLVAALGLGWHISAQARPSTSPPSAGATAPVWLGVAVTPVPEAVRAQLPESVAEGTGVLVRQVVPGSPAERAGLKRNDLLLSFGGEPLTRPGDLVRRVRSAKPGDKVTIELLRRGKPMQVEVTLEDRFAHVRRPPLRRPPTPPLGGPADQVQVWEQFQSLSVVKNPDGNYTAVVEYLDEKGDKKRFEYQGTRDEISAQVRKERALPDGLKQQLLDALSDRMPSLPMAWPEFPDIPRLPGLDDDFFAPPPWWGPGRRGFWD